MSRARGHSLERGFCLGLAGFCVCLGCSSDFSATSGGSGNGNAGGGASHAGGGGRDETAGGSPSTAGSAAGGTGAVGGGGSGGSGHGGKGTCEIMECFVANTCLDKCGGNVVYTGCCACEPPSVNKLTCAGTP